MILLKRLTGQPLAVNPDLIERIEANPDTVLTMDDDKRILVHETVQEIIALVIDYRAEILRQAYREQSSTPMNPAPPLRLIHPSPESGASGEQV